MSKIGKKIERKPAGTSPYKDNHTEIYDKNYFFTKYNERCIECDKECKQSYLVDVVMCPKLEEKKRW